MQIKLKGAIAAMSGAASTLSLMVFFLAPANAQQITGTPGSPSATVTIDG